MHITTAVTYQPKTIFEKLTLNSIRKMTKGRLNVLLPNGEELTFGDGKANYTANVRINNYDCFRKFVLYGDVGFGEAYVDGDWDTDNITHFISWVLLNVNNAPTLTGSALKEKIGLNLLTLANKVQHFFRKNNLEGSRKNIAQHYDLGNDFYRLWLDDTMTYSSAYFKEEGISLREAQIEKYDRLCKELKLSENDHVLEIGTGWGSMAAYMAKKYGCKVTTLTISAEQHKLAKARMQENGIAHLVNVELKDYRNIEGRFDKIVSIEMLEAVGHQFLPVYFSAVNKLLKPQGLLALQVITCPDSRYQGLRSGIDWIQKHIFPGSLLPSVAAINKAVNETSDLTLVDLKDFGRDYAKTLKLWHRKFNEVLSEVKELGFDETFIRKWNYYLCYCEAAFEMRNINVMQLVYARPNNLLA